MGIRKFRPQEFLHAPQTDHGPPAGGWRSAVRAGGRTCPREELKDAQWPRCGAELARHVRRA
eukprot:15436611-Alexandrium_andersonii.AAC.1